MTKTKSTKRALLMSALALLMCVSMLIGSTFAWFTDSVTSSGNIIKSGTLDVTMEWKDATANGAQQTYKDASLGAIFNYDLWEPGYVEAKNIKIGNAGTLALKYQLSIEAIGEVSILADVIDVYYAEGEYTLASRDMSELTRLGTLNEVLAAISTTASGDLLEGESDTVTLALKMQESANNDYQGLSIGSEFAVKLMATQLTHEFDSFDNQYDAGATWVGTIPTSLEDTTLNIVPGDSAEDRGTITINSAEDLVYLNKLAAEWVSLYSNGQGTNVGSYRENVGGKGTAYYYHWQWTIKLATDLDMSNIPMNSVDISYWDNFEGNGHTISNVVLKDGQDGLFINGAKAINNLTVKNITVNAPAVQTVGAVSGNGAMTNVHVENAVVTGGKYVGGICGKGSSFVNCSIKNSTVTGTDKTVGGLVGYSIGDPDAATVSGNVVENVTVIGAYNVGGLLGQSQNETVNGNTVKNVTVTSTTELPANASSNEVRAAEIAARSAFDNTTIGENSVENVTVVPEPPAKVSTVAELSKALKEGKNVVLTEDIALTSNLVATKDVVIDLNGKTIKTTASSSLFQSQSNAAPSMIITSSTAGAVIDATNSTFNNGIVHSYGKTEIRNVTINAGSNKIVQVQGNGSVEIYDTVINADSGKTFDVAGDFTLGKGTVVNVTNLNSNLISNNGAHAIVIDGAEINVGTFKVNGSSIITLNQASTLEMKNTKMKIDNFVLSSFGGDSLVSKVDGVTIENCTFDVTDSNGASCTFVAKDGKYRLVQN